MGELPTTVNDGTICKIGITRARMNADALEKRQHQLAQKQRQLHSQFEQLQQMCPPPNSQ
ncbi:hypothetical protein Tcan_13144 [Toxocara canis]|uniref:Uncharacterized protein n=1 Tax=Toxocara canis TaxID=6265 RepID=A0A0B2W3N5_TOXCA|nr:hypothetical protein Tcan_13144 [Toxocara canis]